jgi:DNA invertase Pin-like site-specific DNA recombinase
MLAIFAQFESDTTKERTAAGMARAKQNGSQVGRAPKLTAQQLDQMEKLILSPRAHKLSLGRIARRFDVSVGYVNMHFPCWRSKSERERKAWRRTHPLLTK